MSLTASSLNSTLELAFESDPAGVTRLRRRKAGGLCHIGKPYWNGEVLLTQLINPTAGLFEGDRLEARVSLGPGSSVLLSNPSATRFHTMAGGTSLMTQHFELGHSSFLELQPDLLIPQTDSSCQLRTTIETHGDAAFFFPDILAPGRTGHGESLAWRDIATGLDILIDGSPVARERARLVPSLHAWRLRSHDGQPCYTASIWMRFPHLHSFSEKLAHAETLLEPYGHAGATEIDPGLAVLRFMTPSSARLRKACALLRSHWAQWIPPMRARTGKL